MSQRRTCRVLGQHRSTQRKAATTLDDEAAFTADITESDASALLEVVYSNVDARIVIFKDLREVYLFTNLTLFECLFGVIVRAPEI
ncbi:hypothetical protein M2281_003643 [Mesorhizobium soli]|nr:hypothetical protein [Mesorhizobium soli]